MAATNKQPSINSFAIGLLLGSVIGAALALWFAPKSGKQMQSFLFKQGAKLRKQATQRTDQLYNDVKEVTAQTLEKVDGLQQEGQEYLNQQGEQMQGRFEAVKTKLKKATS